MEQITIIFWGLICIGYSSRYLNSYLYHYSTYGKLDNLKLSSSRSTLQLTETLGVSCKMNFTLCYMTGLLSSIYFIYFFYKNAGISVYIYSMLLFVHLARRLLETLFVTEFSERKKIRIPLFLTAILIYIFIPLTIFQLGFETPSSATCFFKTCWSYLVGLSVFLFWSVVEFQSHWILANLRSGRSIQTNVDDKIALMSIAVTKQEIYFIPKGGLFNMISCPHYLSEIGIYFSFLFMSMFSNGSFNILRIPLSFWLMLTFFILNLTSRAIETHQWYLDKFKDMYPRNRKALIPLIW